MPIPTVNIDLAELRQFCKIEDINQLTARFNCSHASIYNAVREAKKLFRDNTLYVKEREMKKQKTVNERAREKFEQKKERILSKYKKLYELTENSQEIDNEFEYEHGKQYYKGKLLKQIEKYINDLNVCRFRPKQKVILEDKLLYEEMFVAKELFNLHKVITKHLYDWLEIQIKTILESIEIFNPVESVINCLKEDLQKLHKVLRPEQVTEIENNIKKANSLLA